MHDAIAAVMRLFLDQMLPIFLAIMIRCLPKMLAFYNYLCLTISHDLGQMHMNIVFDIIDQVAMLPSTEAHVYSFLSKF